MIFSTESQSLHMKLTEKRTWLNLTHRIRAECKIIGTPSWSMPFDAFSCKYFRITVMGETIDLSRYRVPGSYETFYIPDFITVDEEQYLLRKIAETPQSKWKQLANRRLQIWGGEVTSKNVLFSQGMPSFLGSYPDIITRLRNTGAFSSSPHGAPNHVILNEYLPGQGIMPHQDGPSYYPVVATISIGSHSVFHYYKFNTQDDQTSYETGPLWPEDRDDGRIINRTPVLTVFLEPRSLVISRELMYISHLHGIEGTFQDRIFRKDKNKAPTVTDLNVDIANWEMLSGQEIKKVIEEGGILPRNVRYSLTCRDVERVLNAHQFMRR
ncbi:hypothetical protein H2248_002837 [Termitomyces sp. 'cryptogamus']|nr:hypothetical protein H2248_002837 [Termitomyces sp. 'cryptogamus']